MMSVRIAPDRTTSYMAASAQRFAATPERLLGVWPHPDDEAYTSAAFMARTVDNGGEVTLLTLSDGEAGFPEDDPRPAHRRGAERRAEMRAAMAEIGITDVRFVGLPDGWIGDYADGRLQALVEDTLHDVRPDLTLTFGLDGFTGHADHIACSQAVTQVWADTGIGDLWHAGPAQTWLDQWRQLHQEIGVWMTEEPTGIRPSDAILALELDGAEVDRKRAVLAAHHSQTAGIAAVMGEEDYRRWISYETFRRPTGSELRLAAAGAPADRRRELVA